MYDIVFTNCRIVDGTGAPWQRGDVAVKDGRIVKIGKILPDGAGAGAGAASESAGTAAGTAPDGAVNAVGAATLAKDIVDCKDHYLTPGFIDIHSHSDTTLMAYPLNESRILQGVTTEMGANCGISAAPVSNDEARKKDLKDYVGDLDFTWRTMDDYLKYMEEVKASSNFCMAVGHGTLRAAAMGFDDRRPEAAEMDAMKGMLEESLQSGAFCMSSGLIYPPGVFSEIEEMKELCKILPKYGAFYCTHMRNEGGKLIEAVEEAIEVARASGAPLEISHHKALREENWRNLCYKSTAIIEKAREDGIDVRCDQYPYIATATTLDSNVPSWAFVGGVEKMLERLQDPDTRARLKEETNRSHEGRWHNIFVSYARGEKYSWAVGKNMIEISEIEGKDPADACFDIIIDTRSRVGEINYSMCEDDVEYIMQKPYVMIGSDGNAFSLEYDGQPHPRAFGTFPRVIAHYSRDRKLFTIEEAIRKMTSMPADRIGLNDRGLIKEGFAADIVVFDLDEIEDTPTFENPKAACGGIERVYVNGVLTAKDGVHTGARAGEVLRRNGLY